jgi:hypothetical protein
MYETELVFAGILGAWVLYELYGRTALEWLSAYAVWIRIAGGAAVLSFLYWQARSTPEEFTDSLDLAKQFLTSPVTSTGSTKEKRNVSALLKKKIAASQQWKCGSCKALLDETFEVDHRVALFNGGSNDPENLIALCPHCHRKKTVDERLNA